MNFNPIAKAIAMQYGISTPKARMPILLYIRAGGPFNSVKV